MFWLGYCRTECKISTPETELDRLKTELLCGYDSSLKPEPSEGSNITTVYMYLALRRFALVRDSVHLIASQLILLVL